MKGLVKNMVSIMKKIVVLGIALFLVACTLAEEPELNTTVEIELPALFSDGMVLQRQAKIPVWGWAVKNANVTVTFSNQSKSTTAGEDGKWLLYLDPLTASAEPAEFTVKVGDKSKVVKDVLVGEVWLCSGQSNMDFTLKSISNKSKKVDPYALADMVKKEITEARDPLLRQIKVEKCLSPFSVKEKFEGEWINSSPDNNASFTAVGYYFARVLRKKLNVPVGLIKSAWGGTRVEPWIPMEAYQGSEKLKTYYQQEIGTVKNWDPIKAKELYEKQLAEWKKEVEKAKSEKRNKRVAKPRMTRGPDSNNRIPSAIYNTQIHPLIPFAIKGVIWYQGESNKDHCSEEYADRFTTLIRSWRKAWGQGDFPFYYAQLANFSAISRDPIETDDWATVCDQQRLSLREKNTGMAVLNDIGDAGNIHPKNKFDVGLRLALWALAKDYGNKDLVFSGPLYKNSVFEGAKVTVTFSHVGDGLMVGEKKGVQPTVEIQAELKGFQICGADRVWQWANAKIVSTNQVEVSHPQIKKPVEVRYAWAKNADFANLYNKAGLPTSLFKSVNPSN